LRVSAPPNPGTQNLHAIRFQEGSPRSCSPKKRLSRHLSDSMPVPLGHRRNRIWTAVQTLYLLLLQTLLILDQGIPHCFLQDYTLNRPTSVTPFFTMKGISSRPSLPSAGTQHSPRPSHQRAAHPNLPHLIVSATPPIRFARSFLPPPFNILTDMGFFLILCQLLWGAAHPLSVIPSQHLSYCKLMCSQHVCTCMIKYFISRSRSQQFKGSTLLTLTMKDGDGGSVCF
jgi:hypothetical protein